MLGRTTYDLSHYSIMTGQMGRLQTLSCIPVIAGDSFSLNLEAVLRLAPLRRDLVLDAKVDLFAFFVPHRHVYGQNWIDFIKQGIDESITFSTITFTTDKLHLGGPRMLAGTWPLWIMAGYNQIWNRYFRPPTDLTNVVADTALSIPGDDNTNNGRYGYPCARLKTVPGTGVDVTTDTSDREVAAASSTLDIIDFAKIQARYRTEQERDWFGIRYNDLLGKVFGSNVNIDADQRPELVMRVSSYLSGYDVDGTDDASLGTFSGKSIGVVRLNLPRKFFVEHGALWIMALIRFPTVWDTEIPYLYQITQPTYKQISGDPHIWAAEPPAAYDTGDWFQAGGSVALGTMPYGQWYRYHPSVVHGDFREVTGFPFQDHTPTDKDDARLHTIRDYDEVFQTVQLGHWRCQARVNCTAQRVIPSAKSSIFAGV